MRIAVLYDGDAQARLMLESNGHDCVGFEPRARWFKHAVTIGSGRCVQVHPDQVNLDAYDGVWVNAHTAAIEEWARTIENRPLWINGEEIK